jgi:hypothetical protein
LIPIDTRRHTKNKIFGIDSRFTKNVARNKAATDAIRACVLGKLRILIHHILLVS